MLQSEAGYIDARPLTANSRKFSCNARPDHTLGHSRRMPTKAGVGSFPLFPETGHQSKNPISDVCAINDQSASQQTGPIRSLQSAHRCGRSRRVTAAALLPSGGRVAGPEHDDFRADWRAVVEIDDLLVRQADTAGRDVGANGPGFIGAVDAV